MSASKIQINIRKALLYDLQDMMAIDQAIRGAEELPTTYSGFTTEHVFGLDKTKVDPDKRASLLGEVAKLLGLAFVAESEGHVCGFIVGRQYYIFERDIQIGEIALFGIHPDYRRQGIASKLVNALCDLYLSRGVHRILAKVDPTDTKLAAFFKHMGFSGEELISYRKQI